MPVNEQKLMDFVGKAVGDVGAALSAALVVIGDKLGLYKALAASGPLTPAELGKKTGTAERYVREWLCNQAAGGYIAYDAKAGKFFLPAEQAVALADESSPFFLPGAFQGMTAAMRATPKILESFRTGRGLDWSEHDPDLFEGTERFFRPNYVCNLVKSWIPSLEGVGNKLREGASVADVGCGHGASTLLMAKAFPQSKFVGFDYHGPSIETARSRAKLAGLANASFEVAPASGFPGKGYDLVAFFDCLHDMGDPVTAAAHTLETLDRDGTCMVVEPFANDRMEENFNPVGRVFYGASTLICTPASLAQKGAMALGAQAGEARMKEVFMKAGFKRFRRATETPFNLVLEARP